MSAYIIVDTRIKNPEAYEDYKAKARPIAEKFGGVYLARGGDMDVVQDELWSPTRIVLIQFPNKDRRHCDLPTQIAPWCWLKASKR